MLVAQLRRRVIFMEATGFLAVIAVLWLDEILDLPHAWFGFQATPVNWVEGLTETVMTLLCAGVVMASTSQILRHLKMLQGMLPVCSHCHRVRDDRGAWRQIEAYVRDHTGTEFSHGICPDCLRVHYPGYCDDADPPAVREDEKAGD
ncbi:MAG: hypothetical protein WC326_05400 [Candidatus Delongbacteria bacterium]